MKQLALICMVLSTFSLSACQTLQGRGNKELVGGASGAVIGGLLGSQLGSGSGSDWAMGVGVLLGALVGSDIGASLDKADLAYANEANQSAHAAPLGETIDWSNPDSGHFGSVTPTRDGYSSSGRYCREYQQSVTIDGRQEKAFGSACQQPDGSWQIVQE